MKHTLRDNQGPLQAAKNVVSYLRKPQVVILVITLLLLIKVLPMGQLVYGDIPYFDIHLSKVNFLFAWGPEQLGTSVRQSLNTFRDQVILSVSPFNYAYYFLKYVLPILCIPIVYYQLFKKFGFEHKATLIIASLFPLLTPVMFGDFLTGQTFWIYLTVPAVFYFAVKLFCLHEFTLRNNILLAAMLFLSLGMLPPIIIPLLVTLVLFAGIAFLLSASAKEKGIFKGFITSGIIVFGTFFVLAAPYMLVASSGQQSYTPPSLLGDYYHNYSGTHFLNVFRLAGNNGSGQNTLGYNTTSLTNMVGYLIFLLTIAGSVLLGLRRKNDRYQTAILTCLIVMLLLVGFMDFLATQMTYGAKLFESQWIVSTIRNPSKLYVIILPLFSILFAFCLHTLCTQWNRQWQRRGVIAIVGIMLCMYGWPALRGDMGLLYKREDKAASYKQDPLIADITKQVPDQSRSLLIPSDHHDELNYQNINPGFNVVRLEGGLPQTSQFMKSINSAFNARDDYFFNYTAAAGIRNFVAKKDPESYKAALFSIFPTALTPGQTDTFLRERLGVKKESTYYWHYASKQASDLVYGAEQITSIQGENSLRSKAPFMARNTAVIDTPPPAAFTPLVAQYTATDTLQENSPTKEGRAQLHTPNLIQADIYTSFTGGQRMVVFDIINPLSQQVENSVKQPIQPNTTVVALDDDYYTVSPTRKRITLRAGDYTLYAGSIESVDISATNPSFEQGVPNASDASTNRAGKPSIYSAQSSDATDGKAALTLGSGNHLAYIEKPVPITDQSERYLLTFDYKNIRGAAPTLSIMQGDTATLVNTGELEASTTWTSHEAYFRPDPDIKGHIQAYVYTDSIDGQASENTIDNFRLYRVVANDGTAISLPNYASDYPIANYVAPPSNATPSRNLLANSSFEDKTLWGKVGDASASASGKADVKAAQTRDAQHGNYALELSSTNHTAYVARKVMTYTPNSVYKLSFYYKHISGKRPSFTIWQNGTSIARPSQELKESNGDWQYFETYFVPEPTTTSLTLYFYAPSAGEHTVNLYDNVSLTTTSLVSTYLMKQQANSANSQQLVNSFERINPTMVRVKAKPGQGLLVFNESFHKGWKAYVTSKADTSLSSQLMLKTPGQQVSDHIMVNGFANGWWIDSKDYHLDGDYEIVLMFAPQRTMFIGFLGTIFGSIAIIMYLLYSRTQRTGWRWR